MLARTESIEVEVASSSESLATMLARSQAAASEEVVPWYMERVTFSIEH